MARSASRRSSCAGLPPPGATVPNAIRTASTASRSAGWWRRRGSVRPGSWASTGPDQVDPFYEALPQQRVEVAPVHFDGVGYLRIAAAPYNTPDDYDRLAGTVRELLNRHD
jgi:hypothetical protein